MSGQDNARAHADKSSNRNGYGFTCAECNAKFNRLAHLRRHQMTHGGEKPYNCLYCPVASSRKDVIIRHTRNFHPAAANRNSAHYRGKRRNASCSGAPASNELGNGSLRASSTTGSGGNDQNSEEANDQTEELQDSPASNEIDGSPTNQENLLDALLPSQTDMFPSYLQENPLNFSSAFMEPGLVNPDLSEIIDLNILLSNAHDFLGGMPSNNTSELPALAPELPRRSVPDLGRSQGAADRTLAVDDDDCATALANIAKYPAHIFASLRFPSKYAMRRFVKAFFQHIAAHIPIVHEPTFDIATAPSPLLLATMACGAAYLSEHSVAVSMHAVAMQLISEHERMVASWMTDTEPQTWMLQTYLLLSYFGVHCGMEGRAMEGRANHTLPHSVRRAQEALGELKMYPITTYKDWVRQECINRCIASTILLGATVGSNERTLLLVSPVIEARFTLPSDTAEWLKNEASWKAPEQVLYSDVALKSIFAGQAPDLPVSEFGLVTIVSTILYRVCSFEMLAGSHDLELYTNFGEKMGGAVRTLDDMLKRRMGEAASGLAPDPITQCAKSLLNSVFYHLYGSNPLAIMKKLLLSPSPLDSPEEIMNLLDEASSPDLYKALIRAADQLRFDCRLGLKYLRKMAPLKFGPESAISIYEGALLLCWYLQFAHSRLPQVESHNILSALIDEGFAEVEELRLQVQDRRAAVPLAVSLELLSDNSVWQWPSSVSQKLGFLIKRFKAMDYDMEFVTTGGGC